MFVVSEIPIKMKFLIIRRDNIGDLVCTTPLIHALRERFPTAQIDALVNSYNHPVLENNPDLNHVYAYTKASHREVHETVLGVYWRRFKLLLALRREHYDYVVLANSSYFARPLQLARFIKAKNTIGFTPTGAPVDGITLPVSIEAAEATELTAKRKPLHEVEKVFHLLSVLNINGTPPKLQLRAQPAAHSQGLLRTFIEEFPAKHLIAIHISSRKLPQRWSAENFSSLMHLLNQQGNYRFLLLWSPGAENNPRHPGDDDKAALIIAATRDLPVLAYPTEKLSELINALALCQAMVCSDGGAMHIGAGLGLPMVCFFGNSDPDAWHPWGVAHEVLRKPSQEVNDISALEAAEAFARLKVMLV